MVRPRYDPGSVALASCEHVRAVKLATPVSANKITPASVGFIRGLPAQLRGLIRAGRLN